MDINNWLALNPTCGKYDGKYGAQIGDRGKPGDPNRAYKFHLQKITPVDGDYDRAGTYWGFGGKAEPLWGYMCEDDEDGLVYGFVRARFRGDAKSDVRKTYPNARFYR